MAFERDTKRRRKQEIADDGKCDKPYDVELHIPKQIIQKGWMKELKLISADRQILQCHRKWVNDRLINAAQQMLRKQYGVPGLEDVGKGETLSMDVHKGEFIQILNVGKVHWVTISTIDCNPGVIKVYDSGGKYITYRNQEQIAALLFTQQNMITVQFMGVMRQYGASDCGLFAIANATALCNGIDPTCCVYQQSISIFSNALKLER